MIRSSSDLMIEGILLMKLDEIQLRADMAQQPV